MITIHVDNTTFTLQPEIDEIALRDLVEERLENVTVTFKI